MFRLRIFFRIFQTVVRIDLKAFWGEFRSADICRPNFESLSSEMMPLSSHGVAAGWHFHNTKLEGWISLQDDDGPSQGLDGIHELGP